MDVHIYGKCFRICFTVIYLILLLTWVPNVNQPLHCNTWINYFKFRLLWSIILDVQNGCSSKYLKFILREHFEYINSKNYHLQYNIFSAIGKVYFWKKCFAFWDNKFLIKQLTIQTKMLVCTLGFMLNKFHYFIRGFLLFSFKTVNILKWERLSHAALAR